MLDSMLKEGALIRIAAIVAIAVGCHALVAVVRRLGAHLGKADMAARYAKARTVTALATNALVFLLYFGALGLVLRELGVSLTAYLASASVIGLAVAFGSQGLVQDVVTGVTVVFSDLFDVGDVVEIAGQTGVVCNVGVRFTVVRNFVGADVYIPNRTIANVVRYQHGYVTVRVDVRLPSDPETVARMVALVEPIARAYREHYPDIVRGAPVFGRHRRGTGTESLEVRMRVWPGQGALIESAFKQEVTHVLQAIEPTYADWMVTVTYGDRLVLLQAA